MKTTNRGHRQHRTERFERAVERRKWQKRCRIGKAANAVLNDPTATAEQKLAALVALLEHRKELAK